MLNSIRSDNDTPQYIISIARKCVSTIAQRYNLISCSHNSNVAAGGRESYRLKSLICARNQAATKTG